MSLHGNSVFQTLNGAFESANRSADQSREHLAGLNQHHSNALRQLRDAYDVIVKARLKNPSEDHAALRKVDSWLMNAANQRQQEYQDIVSRLDQAQKDAAQKDEGYRNAITRHDRAELEWKNARDSVRDFLSGQDAFRVATERHAEAVRRSEAVDEHLDEITKTTEDFEKICMADPLFVYCHERNVGTHQAAGWWLVRGLDRAVARANNYYDNRATLLDAKADLKKWVEHQSLLTAELSESHAAVEKAIDEALENPEGKKISSELSESEASMQQSALARDQSHARVAMLKSNKDAYDQDRDPISIEMEKNLLSAVEKATSATLLRAASETSDASDDRAAAKVVELRKEIPRLVKQINEADKKANEDQEKARSLHQLATEFKRQGFDRRYSRFNHGFDPIQMANHVLLGRMTVASAIHYCASAHRDVTPPPPPVYSSSSSSSGSFGSSGGFKSGGGFSGGGGFKTGGRF